MKVKLLSVELTDFMNIQHASLDTSKSSVVLIIGENGNGKSALLDAIGIAFTEKKRGDTYKEYIRLGASQSHIHLVAEIDGSVADFDITIKPEGTALERKVTYLGKEYNNSEVSDLLEQLGFKYFGNLIISTQGDNDVTKLTPSERAVYLQKLLNFDFSEKKKALKDQIDAFNEKIKYNGNQLEFIDRSIKSKQAEVVEVPPCEYSQADVDRIQVELQAVNAQVEEYNSLCQKQTDISYKISTNESERARLARMESSADVAISSNTAYKQNAEQRLADLQQYVDKVAEADAQIASINDMIAVDTAAAGKSSASYNELFNKSQEALRQLATARAKRQEAENHMKLISKGTCPECGHTFDASDTAKYQQAVEDTKADEVSCQARYNEADAGQKAVKKEWDAQTERVVGYRAQLRAFESNKATYMAQLNSKAQLESSISLYERTIAEKTTEKQNYVEQLTGIEAEQAELQKQFDDVHAHVTALAGSVRDASLKTSELNHAMSAINTYNIAVSRVNAAKADIEKLNADHEAVLAENEEVLRQKSVYDDAYAIVDKHLPNYMIVKACARIQKEMNRFLRVVFPTMKVQLYQSKRGVEFYYRMDCKGDEVYEKKDMVSAKMASGFEKSALTMAFKVALCRAYKMTFSFMDEVDSAGSDECSDKMFTSIIQNNIFEQLFIITHKPAVRDSIAAIADVTTYYVTHGEFSTEE